MESRVRDMNSRLERRTEELAYANQELDSFGHALAHDLRGALARIYSVAQFLEEEKEFGIDEEGRKLLLTITDSCRHMIETIGAIHDLTRLTSAEPVRRETDLGLLAAGIAEELRCEHPERRVEFSASPGLVAHCDPKLMRIVLSNLLGNAWKFTRNRPDARVEFGAIDEGGERIFFVRDNGAGFRREDAERLFLPFRRLHREEEFAGTGVGLSATAGEPGRRGRRGPGRPSSSPSRRVRLYPINTPRVLAAACRQTSQDPPQSPLPCRGEASNASRGVAAGAHSAALICVNNEYPFP
jgi:light-regulated signal transduction histidine kinase (bacteriophytochrome)